MGKRALVEIAAAPVFALPQPAYAYADVTAPVMRLYANSQFVLVKMDATVTGHPSCATDTGWDFAIPLANTHAVSMLLTARANNTPIRIVGDNACNVYGSVESVQFVQL